MGMVVLLYDRLVRDIHQAIAALNAGDVEARSGHVNHALLILQQLQGTLDFQRGGDTARQLETFYSYVRGKLLEAQICQSRDLMLEQVRAITDVRECWAKLETPAPTIAAHETVSAPAPEHSRNTAVLG